MDIVYNICWMYPSTQYYQTIARVTAVVCWTNCIFSILYAVVVELVIRPQCWQGASANRVGKEDLGSRVYPALRGPQLRPVRCDVQHEACACTLQGDSSEQQGYHHKVREECGEPDNLEMENMQFFVRFISATVCI